ncbi:MAG: hypothetical protein K9W43_13510 [Candidatus Thorarchaeota archaeon]|nr:hypothetical protein [Candidatus Thorarchaeota archaeon]
MQIHRNKMLLFTLVIVSLMLGTSFMTVDAVAVPYVYQTGSQSLSTASDGSIYTVLPADNPLIWPHLTLAHSTDFSYKTFSYYLHSWTYSSSSYKGPANRSVDFSTTIGDSSGWLDGGTRLPVFWKFTNQSNDLSATLNWRMREFPLAVGQNTTTVLETNSINIGLLNVTEKAEYYYVTIENQNDNCMFYIGIIGPQGKFLIEWGVNRGDTIIIPLQFVGIGLYRVLIWADASSTSFVTTTISVDAITPIELPVNQLTQGVLSGSEWVVDQKSGDIIYEEQVPTAYTFKITSPYGLPGKLRYSFNYPELQDGTYEIHEPTILVTANISTSFLGLASIYGETLNPDYGEWLYQSYNNQSYYVTIMGMDNIMFSVMNEYPEVSELPINTNFFMDAAFSTEDYFCYMLHLGEDSLVIINSTEYNGGFSWSAHTYYNGRYTRTPIPDSSAFSNAGIAYLPAGDYLIMATPQGPDSNGFYKVTVGPIIDGTGLYSVADSSVIGVRVNADILNHYAVNVSLMTNDNVSVTTKINLFSETGRSITSTTPTLGHVQNGFGWTAVGANFSTLECGLMTSRSLDDGGLIIALKPYDTKNTTTGAPTNELPGKVHTFDVDFVDYMSEAFNGTVTLDATSGSGFRSVPLEEPQDSSESYVFQLTLKADQWYNVSVRTADVTSISMSLFQDFNGRIQTLTWSYLDDTMIGSVSDMGLQIPSIGTDAVLVVAIDRNAGVDTGSLNITLTEMLTNVIILPADLLNLAYPVSSGTTFVPTDWLAQNGLVLVAGAGVAVAAVVIVLVVLKKRRP